MPKISHEYTVPFGDAESKPLAVFDDGRTDGYVASEKCMGTYIHGILDNPAFVERLLKPFADKINADAGVFDTCVCRVAGRGIAIVIAGKTP